MMLRPKRFRPSVITTEDAARPIMLTAGPGLQFELKLGETRQLLLALHAAYERVQQRHVGGDG